jgi:hypothetical protein
MGHYVRTFNETFDFDGDTITVTLKQLKRIDAMELLPAMRGMQGMDLSNPETMTKERMDCSNEFVTKAAEIVKRGDYIVKIRGMLVDGKEVDAGDELFSELLEDFYFTGFVSKIAGLLVKHSSISKEEEKKLDRPSAESGAVSVDPELDHA